MAFPHGQYVDPSYLAQLHAQQRGLRDLVQDTTRERKRLRQDTGTQIKDTRVSARRGRQDVTRERSRGLQDIGFQREDVRTTEQRGTEDFGTRLTNLIRDYQTLGRTQTQTAMAAGVTGGSYGQAAAAARSYNLGRERQPIDTGLTRLHEDTASALGRLGVEESRVREDAGTQLGRIRQDRRHDIGLARREQGRGMIDIRTERKRGRRELAASRGDLSQQAAFNARLMRQSLNPFQQG